MKKYLQSLVAIILLVLLIPIIPLIGKEDKLQEEFQNHSNTVVSSAESPPSSEPTNATPEETVTVFQAATQKVDSMPLIDYLVGVVFAEIPASFHEESIKAQAVAAHTYLSYVAEQEKASPSPELKGAQISVGADKHQAFDNKSDAKKRYGKDFDSYYTKIKQCVEEVLSQTLTYEEKPILSAFHAVSAGKTESSKTVWNAELPYLIGVDSTQDSASPNYIANKSFSEKEMRALLKKEYPDAEFSNTPESWIQISSLTPSGYVDSLSVLGNTQSGQQARTLFELKSAAFTLSYQDKTFTFTTRGYGHGVGMSQYGSNQMATEGKTYQEILAHYYPNTVLKTAE